MSDPSCGAWRDLFESENAPLLPWRDTYPMMLRMSGLCQTDEAAQNLITAFASTRSATFAAALCGALTEYASEPTRGERIALLLAFFEQLRLKSHFATMDTLISKISYVIQRDRLIVEQQQILCQLCISAVEMCEQMPPDEWISGRLDDVLERTSLIAQHGLSEITRQTPDAVLLDKLLHRARAISERATNKRERPKDGGRKL